MHEIEFENVIRIKKKERKRKKKKIEKVKTCS